jgi:hypothetical protein
MLESEEFNELKEIALSRFSHCEAGPSFAHPIMPMNRSSSKSKCIIIKSWMLRRRYYTLKVEKLSLVLFSYTLVGRFLLVISGWIHFHPYFKKYCPFFSKE